MKGKEAMNLYQTALDIYLKSLGPDHTLVATCYNNMVIVLDDQGK